MSPEPTGVHGLLKQRKLFTHKKYANDREMLDKVLNTEQRFKNLERSAAEIINAATNSKIKLEQGKETVDMCLAIQEMREESRIEGREEVKKSFMVKYKKSEQETEELMKIYWK